MKFSSVIWRKLKSSWFYLKTKSRWLSLPWWVSVEYTFTDWDNFCRSNWLNIPHSRSKKKSFPNSMKGQTSCDSFKIYTRTRRERRRERIVWIFAILFFVFVCFLFAFDCMRGWKLIGSSFISFLIEFSLSFSLSAGIIFPLSQWIWQNFRVD